MASPKSQDKRILERAVRRGDLTQAEISKQIAQAADLEERVEPRSEEEMERLRTELETESVARAERIQRFIEEGPLPTVRPEPVLIDESDL